MKRKISLLLALTLVATNLIACNEAAQVVDSASSQEPITFNEVSPSEINDANDSNESNEPTTLPVAVILEGDKYIDDLDNIMQFMSIIENATLVEESPIFPAGGYVFKFHLISSDDSIREFDINGSILIEYVDGENVYYTLDDIQYFDFVLSLVQQPDPNSDNPTPSVPTPDTMSPSDVNSIVPEPSISTDGVQTLAPSVPQGDLDLISDLYDNATEIFTTLHNSTLTFDMEKQATINDRMYFKVKDYNSLEELNTHLLTFFAQEVIDDFTVIDTLYCEYEGGLYVQPADAPTNMNMGQEISRDVEFIGGSITVTVEIETLENGEVNGSEFFEFTTRLINQNWVFTSFPQIK